MPSATGVELVQVDQQVVHGSIEMRRLFRDPFTQPIELAIHEDCISSEHDIIDLTVDCVVQADRDHAVRRAPRHQVPPDPEIFKNVLEFSFEQIATELEELASLSGNPT